MENPFEEQQSGRQRPQFLTVLCILTFIGSGWGILSNLFSIFTADMLNDSYVQMEQYSTLQGEMEGNASFWANFLRSSMEMAQVAMLYAREIATMQLVLGIVSLLGAVLMFQLRRVGFYLYVTAQILMLLVFPYFAGFSSVVILSMFGSALFSVVFIAMYAVHVKYMGR
ncbi:MAG: hypothetical protein K2I90_08165 [Odoribacter sp.]|nr:hypothetical protein [Odoribacter sp.]